VVGIRNSSHNDFPKTHRWPTAVGFFLPLLARSTKQTTSHMNNKDNAVFNAAYIRDYDYNPETYALKALIDIYLIAGLTHYDAVLCALADYECNLQPPLQCAA